MTKWYRGFSFAVNHDHGFRLDHRLTMRIDPTLAGYTLDQTNQIYKTLVERAAQVPGVKSAALSWGLPMTNNLRLGPVVPEGYQFPAGQATAAVFNDAVDHNFFATFGVPIIAGRGFLETDRTGSPPVVVVNARFACPLDERVLTADITLTPGADNRSLHIHAAIETTQGPFSMVLHVGQVRVELLEVNPA